MLLLLYGGMSGETSSAEAGAGFVEADETVAARAGQRSRARSEEQRDKSTRAVIVSSLFLVLIAAALLIGGHAAIDPLLRSAAAARQSPARQANGRGDVVYTMPDGVYCRHMSFDNATAEVVEGTVEPCSEDIAHGRSSSSNGFTWDTR
jgi:hypothetical protein